VLGNHENARAGADPDPQLPLLSADAPLKVSVVVPLDPIADGRLHVPPGEDVHSPEEQMEPSLHGSLQAPQ
jgi:hypothetical protein